LRRILSALGKWGLAVAALAACCAGGAAVSGLLRPTAQAVSENGAAESDHVAAEPAAAEDVAAEVDEAATDPARLDRLLLDGRYAEARDKGERMREKTEGVARDALDYRMSLCMEVLGRRDEALEGYAALVARCPESPAGVAAATGQARLWLRAGKAAQARRHLAALQLRTGRAPLRGHPALGDVAHLLALAMVREIYADELPGPINFAPVHPVAEAAVAPMVAAVKWDAPPPAADSSLLATAVQKTGPKPEAWTVSAAARQAVAADFLNEVAEKAGVRIDWSPEARKQATGRTLTIAADRLQLLDVVGAVAAATDLGWEFTDGKLSISIMPPGPGPMRQAIARRALIEAITAFHEQALAPMVALELGNIEMSAGRQKEATGWYERLIRERSRSPIAIPTYFNLGLVRARLGERGLARDAFYQAADRNPTGPLAALAYLHIGRLYLEDANPTLAARALRRAQTPGTGAVTRTCASLLLATAELLDENPRAAHAEIVDARRTIGEEPFIRPAALLDALSRFRATADPERRERAAADLLTSLLAYQEDSLLGPVGRMLAGQAYRDLALGDEMALQYAKATPGVGSMLALSMKADLAEHLLASGKKGAAPLLREVAAVPGPRAARAELRLAELALKQKRPDECLTRCRKVLSAGDTSTGGDAVRLMGQAYTQKGDHAAAARCFSGRPPAPEATEAAVTQ
jgi:tetratricopeptide (TPR) repeat protein